ncbi:MAG: tRNA(Ile)-lysidine synthetase, partial [Candidatus Latescibacterota bacterium]
MASRHVDTPERLVETVRSFVVANRLVCGGSLVLAAVSGGADSMAMLSILHELTGELDFRLAVGHFNHNLRGRADADSERDHVSAAAAALQHPFYYGEADVASEAENAGESLETASRNARYRFLETLARQIGAGHIATGHTK